MRENAWIYAIMIVAAIIIIYAAVYKGLENNEKRSLGKAGYKRMTDFRIGCSLAKIAKKRKNDRSYFAAATKNIGREWKYEYRADPFLCEITYIPEKGEIVFIVPRQEEFTSDVLIFYKRMRRKVRYEAAERLLKSLS